MKKYLLIFVVVILIGGGIYWLVGVKLTSNPVSTSNQSPTSTSSPISLLSSDSSFLSTLPLQLAYPISQFKDRITKKPFAIYITPQNSPIQPERFAGYHTGVDVEYDDIDEDVVVYAISNGQVTAAQWVAGYGGVVIIKVQIDGQEHSVLYGHLRQSSLAKVGESVTRGQPIGLLGTGYSTETDKERRHLHFAILSNNRIDYKGYVPKQNDLSNWLDPLTVFK